MGDEKVGTTACYEACPPGAIQFGDVNDPASDPSIYAEYPALGRALEDDVKHAAPDPETLREALDAALAAEGANEFTLEELLAVIEDQRTADEEDDEDAPPEIDLDAELIGLLRAVVVLTEDLEVDTETERLRDTGPLIGKARELVGILGDVGVDFEDESVRRRLRLGDEDEDDAEGRLQEAKGTHESTFKLLEDVGTNPNVTYIGNEPGPRAEQVPGPVSYEDVPYPRADGSQPHLLDNRKEVLDDGTVGGM